MRRDLIFSPLSHTGAHSSAKKLFGGAEKDGGGEGWACGVRIVVVGSFYFVGLIMMLRQEPTPEMIAEWEMVWRAHKDKLRPNRKSGADIVKYLTEKYPLRELHDAAATQVVIDNVVMNEHLAERIPEGIVPLAVTFIVENRAEGRKLYAEPDEFLGDGDIFVGVELVSGYYQVEGTSLLWDELCVFQGLDEKDIENFFCVAQYIEAIKKFGQF
ncbi:MAG: hypothetical protein FWE12_01045 [Oscillospiraceae bacterium]|nr:hypothetical protein [Oscillospiraceae bacterium]